MSQLAPPSLPPKKKTKPSDSSAAGAERHRANGAQTEARWANDAITSPIVLDVEGMMCAGCVSTVEKKLLQCTGVETATVNLITGMAAVHCGPEADSQSIAIALTEAGYPAQVRGASTQMHGLNTEANWITRKENEQKDQLRHVITAGSLLLLSTLGHIQHLGFIQNSALKTWLTLPVIISLWFHGLLATLTLIFPARKILIEGFQGVRRGAPNMNTLVSLGAVSAYATSLAALAFPALGWECFFDEPVMLLSFILIGRTLEQRARFTAASSLRSLIALQPAQARLLSVLSPSKPENPSEKSATSIVETIQIPVSQVKVGDHLRVLPSEKIPVDGTITAGQTTIDEAMITGESLPVLKQMDDAVVAGTLNQSGAIDLRVSRTGADTTLGQMIQLVETAQTRKAPIQGLADLIAGYFTYGVLVCAALTFCFWFFIGATLWPEVANFAMGHSHHVADHMMTGHMMTGHTMTGHIATRSAAALTDKSVVSASMRLLVSLKLTIAVIVVACPCALGLATPTAVLVGSGVGAQQGLLIRGGDILEAAHRLDVLVFDKTGTLTTGNPIVTDVLPLVDALSADRLVQLAQSVEKGTQHPLAIAIQQAAADKKLTPLKAENFMTRAGLGVSATLLPADISVSDSNCSDSNCSDINDEAPLGRQIFLGNRSWMQLHQCTVGSTETHLAEGLAKDGKTVVFVACDQQLVGLIGVTDTLRPEAEATIGQLNRLGIETQILSGDSLAAASAIAHQLNLTPQQVQAEVSPEGKVDAISHLQAAGKRVGLVGDGINDAPALAQADVGIALNSGTEVAMETADIVLMGDSLADVVSAIRLSRRTFNKIRQNLVWAFAYNLICIPLAAGVFLPAFGLSLNPGFAGGLMAFSSVTVVINSLLLTVGAKASA